MKKGNAKKGFTIIETTLVIAIAGLIFLMVFVALPGLRATQRDAQRREDVEKLISETQKYMASNRGALPGAGETDRDIVNVTWSSSLANKADTTWGSFYYKYLGDKFVDPEGYNYKLAVVKCNHNGVADAPCSTTGSNRIISDIQSATFPNDYKMLIVLQAACDGSTVKGTVNPRGMAVLYKLSGAGVYCASLSS